MMMESKPVKLAGSWPSSERQGLVPIENHPAVIEFYSKIFKSRFQANHKDAFLKIFGKQSSTSRLEYLHYIWRLEFEGHVFALLSGQRGTSVEIVAEYSKYIGDEKMAQIAIRLVEKLVEQLKGEE